MKVWFGWALALMFFAVGCAEEDPGAPASDVGGASGVGGRAPSAVSGAGGIGGDVTVVRPEAARADGQVITPWDRYCVATFTSALDVSNTFGSLMITANPGDRFLMGAPGFFDETKIFYLTDVGPVVMELKLKTSAPAPFMSSCQGGTTRTYSAVFVDTPVYTDKETTMLSCTLPAGLAVPGDGINYFIMDSGADPTTKTYQVELKQLAPHCNLLAKGYIKAGKIQLGEWPTVLIPIAPLLGPSAL